MNKWADMFYIELIIINKNIGYPRTGGERTVQHQENGTEQGYDLAFLVIPTGTPQQDHRVGEPARSFPNRTLSCAESRFYLHQR